MRRLLGVLRRDGEPRGSLTPAPGLADLSVLLGQVQDGGLKVWVSVDGEREAVPPGIDLSAYRIVQEALTNVIKHAATPEARVTISYRPGSLTVEVANQGPGASRTGSGPFSGRGGAGLIRVVVADDQALVRGGFRVLVDSAPDLKVVGEASDGTEAVALARKERPDVILMDIRMPHLDGLEATRVICGAEETEDVRVLILTTFDLDEYVYAALRAGASGFLLKDTPPTDLLAGIRVVAAGDALLAPSVTRQLIRSNAEIAGRLYLSPATAKTHVGRLLTKLQARDRTQLVVIAYETGLVTPSGS
jgi:DNA-binding NarL/FixJ family response regulator